METNGVEALGALGDPTRRAIFERLARRPMAVGQISAELPVTRPAVSQHLKVLKQAGLVTDQADGTRRIYRINPEGVQAIHQYLDQMWSQALAGFQLAAEQIAQAEQQPAPRPAVQRQAVQRPAVQRPAVQRPAVQRQAVQRQAAQRQAVQSESQEER